MPCKAPEAASCSGGTKPGISARSAGGRSGPHCPWSAALLPAHAVRGTRSERLRLEELLAAGGLRGFLEQPPGAPAEVVQVDLALVRCLGEPLGEPERFVDDRRSAGVAAHVVQDRPLSPGGDDRLGDPLDPNSRAPPAPAVATLDRVQRVDLVGASELAETEKDHPGRA